MSEIPETRLTLLESLKDSQDELSWKEFDRYYGGYIYLIIRGMKVTHHDAQEIRQQVLLKSWKAIPEFSFDDSRGRFRSWLATIVKNTVLDFFRSRSFKNRKNEFALEDQNIDLGDHQNEIDQIVEREWKNHLAELAWNSLEGRFSNKVREAYLMSLKGVHYLDIGTQLDISPGSVQVYKNRIEKALI